MTATVQLVSKGVGETRERSFVPAARKVTTRKLLAIMTVRGARPILCLCSGTRHLYSLAIVNRGTYGTGLGVISVSLGRSITEQTRRRALTALQVVIRTVLADACLLQTDVCLLQDQLRHIHIEVVKDKRVLKWYWLTKLKKEPLDAAHTIRILSSTYVQILTGFVIRIVLIDMSVKLLMKLFRYVQTLELNSMLMYVFVLERN